MGGKEEEKFELRVATSKKPQGPYNHAGIKLVFVVDHIAALPLAVRNASGFPAGF
jgi:hypothetical protein